MSFAVCESSDLSSFTSFSSIFFLPFTIIGDQNSPTSVGGTPIRFIDTIKITWFLRNRIFFSFFFSFLFSCIDKFLSPVYRETNIPVAVFIFYLYHSPFVIGGLSYTYFLYFYLIYILDTLVPQADILHVFYFLLLFNEPN